MKRIVLSYLLSYLFVAANCQTQLPNIVFIFSDDLSFRDLSIYGQREFQTPHLDALIRHSTRFTQAYAGAPECAPSRGTMLTSLHVGHAPIRLNRSARGFEPLPDSAFTFAEMLQEVGYRTGVVGKWGLGYHDTEGRPTNQGFDYHYGYLTHYEAHSYFPSVLYENGKTIPFPENNRHNIQSLYDKERQPKVKAQSEASYDAHGKLHRADLTQATYAPDLLDDKALTFIDRNKHQPFFLYYTANLPHGPPIVDSLRQMTDKTDMDLLSREWGAMVQRLDISVGKLIDKLKMEGLYDNTMIVFASDNGYAMHNPAKNTHGKRLWPDDQHIRNKGPFYGGKFSVWEGGMRVPFTIKMPRQRQPKLVSQPVWLLDLFPTFAELVAYPKTLKIDGYSLLGLMQGDHNAIPMHRVLYFYKRNEQAIRQGPWFAFRGHPTQDLQLFLPAEDQALQVNLADLYPAVTQSLTKVMNEIHEPHPWYWNPGDDEVSFQGKIKRAESTGQTIRIYRPNGLKWMPWERK